jgi:hypothetical protein
MRLFDVVRVRVDVPDQGVRAGDTGSIVLVHDGHPVTYEVEMVDKQGRATNVATLRAGDLELVTPSN